MKLADITCYLFDLDGTLMNSSPVHEQAYRQVLGHEHPALLTAFDYRAISGLTTWDAFRSLGLDEAQSRHCTHLKQSLYREAVAAGAVRAMPGAAVLLEKLSARGAAIGVVTSASRPSATKSLEACGLLSFAAALVTADDVRDAKPAPAPYLAGLAQLKADPIRTVAVEDAASGVTSAKGAGLKVIGVHEPSIATLCDLYFSDLDAFAGALA